MFAPNRILLGNTLPGSLQTLLWWCFSILNIVYLILCQGITYWYQLCLCQIGTCAQVSLEGIY